MCTLRARINATIIDGSNVGNATIQQTQHAALPHSVLHPVRVACKSSSLLLILCDLPRGMRRCGRTPLPLQSRQHVRENGHIMERTRFGFDVPVGLFMQSTNTTRPFGTRRCCCTNVSPHLFVFLFSIGAFPSSQANCRPVFWCTPLFLRGLPQQTELHPEVYCYIHSSLSRVHT